MNHEMKILGLLLAGGAAASIIWSFFVFFIAVGKVDDRIILKYELTAKLHESAGNAVKNIGKEIAFSRAMNELKIKVTAAEVDKEFNTMVEKYGGIYELEKIMLDTQGNTDTLKNSIRTGMMKQKAIEHFAGEVYFTEKDLRGYFDDHKEQYTDFDTDRVKVLSDYRMEKGAEKYEEYMRDQESRIFIKVY